MGDGVRQGRTLTAVASARLRVLREEYKTPVRSGPPGRRATPAHAPVPVNLDVLDRIDEAEREVGEFIAQFTPQAAREAAGRVGQDTYARLEQATAHWDGHLARARDILIIRQTLELAITARDYTVICTIACPRCECMSLSWVDSMRLAVCMYTRCTGSRRPSLWTLAQLAASQVEEASRSVAT